MSLCQKIRKSRKLGTEHFQCVKSSTFWILGNPENPEIGLARVRAKHGAHSGLCREQGLTELGDPNSIDFGAVFDGFLAARHRLRDRLECHALLREHFELFEFLMGPGLTVSFKSFGHDLLRLCTDASGIRPIYISDDAKRRDVLRSCQHHPAARRQKQKFAATTMNGRFGGRDRTGRFWLPLCR